MATEERDGERSPDLPFQAEGFREYVADIDPATAAENEAIVAQLEAAAQEPAPDADAPSAPA
jgi:hypothetical protein